MGWRGRCNTGQKGEGMEERREGERGSWKEAWRPKPAPLPRLGSDTSPPTAALAKHPSHPITAEATAAKLEWKGMMGSRSDLEAREEVRLQAGGAESRSAATFAPPPHPREKGTSPRSALIWRWPSILRLFLVCIA